MVSDVNGIINVKLMIKSEEYHQQNIWNIGYIWSVQISRNGKQFGTKQGDTYYLFDRLGCQAW